MIKKIYYKITIPFFLLYYLLRYQGIWGFKRKLFTASKPSSRALQAYNAYFSSYYGGYIGCESELEGELCFPHGPYGVFISSGSKIGKNVVIFQQVTIGSNSLYGSDKAGSPVIGDNVYIGAGAKIIGKIVIGENCRIGANAVVYEDMPASSVAVQSPTRIINKSNLINRYYTYRNGIRVYFNNGTWVVADENINNSEVI